MSKDELLRPLLNAIFYQDDQLYACLATFPITPGHVVVVWKQPVMDLHLLNHTEYEHLMATVDRIRNVLLKLLNIDKVYLIYMDEARHVHWHLVPRYDEQGFNILLHKPKKLVDFSLVPQLITALNT